MKTRKILLLAAIAALTLVYSLQLVFHSRGAVRVIALTDDPDSISIARSGGEKITLSKEGDHWLIGEAKYPADQAKVAAMLAEIKEIKALGAVSSSTDRERYGLDETSAVVVTASKGGKVLRTIGAGKNSSSSQQSYARIDGGKETILVSGRLRDVFDKPAETLRERTVWKVPPEGITRIDSDFVNSGTDFSANGARKAAFAIAKAGDPAIWQGVPLGARAAPPVDAAKAASWAESLAELKADSFAPAGTTLDGKPLGTLSLIAAGKTITLTVARKEGDTKYLCASSETPYPFFLQKGTVVKLAKGTTEF